jgi:hypothetical protein
MVSNGRKFLVLCKQQSSPQKLPKLILLGIISSLLLFFRQLARRNLEGTTQGLQSPQSVSALDWSRCILHEWPVFRPLGGTDDIALAAFSVRRARAAENHHFRFGLTAAISRCAASRGQAPI